jgi:hypothetical protein
MLSAKAAPSSTWAGGSAGPARPTSMQGPVGLLRVRRRNSVAGQRLHGGNGLVTTVGLGPPDGSRHRVARTGRTVVTASRSRLPRCALLSPLREESTSSLPGQPGGADLGVAKGSTRIGGASRNVDLLVGGVVVCVDAESARAARGRCHRFGRGRRTARWCSDCRQGALLACGRRPWRGTTDTQSRGPHPSSSPWSWRWRLSCRRAQMLGNRIAVRRHQVNGFFR